jgi:myo-inositol-1(or 4)-monophosphatase
MRAAATGSESGTARQSARLCLVRAGALMFESRLQERFVAAQEIAREAGALAMSLPPRGDGANLLVTEKTGKLDICTEADQAVERLIRQKLADRFGDAMLGEEFGGALGERVWIVDPIDGTFNFAHGLGQWGISIGYVDQGVPSIGIVYAPVTDELFAAQLNHGASLNGHPIRVSSGVEYPLIEVGWSPAQPVEPFLTLVARLAEAGCEFRRMGSAALGLAQVAAGRSDAYIELFLKPWDALAGLVLVREAGGWVSDFLAGTGLTDGNPILACAPALRERLSALSGIH